MVRLFIVGRRQGALADAPVDEVMNEIGRHVTVWSGTSVPVIDMTVNDNPAVRLARPTPERSSLGSRFWIDFGAHLFQLRACSQRSAGLAQLPFSRHI